MRYIDAEKLRAFLDEKWRKLADENVKVGGGKWDAEISTYLSVLRLIDSLQQEQLEGIEGVVHHYATVHYLETNTEQLNARLKDFEEGAKVRVFIKRNEE